MKNGPFQVATVSEALEAAQALANQQVKAVPVAAAAQVVTKIEAAMHWQRQVPAAPVEKAEAKASVNKE